MQTKNCAANWRIILEYTRSLRWSTESFIMTMRSIRVGGVRWFNLIRVFSFLFWRQISKMVLTTLNCPLSVSSNSSTGHWTTIKESFSSECRKRGKLRRRTFGEPKKSCIPTATIGEWVVVYTIGDIRTGNWWRHTTVSLTPDDCRSPVNWET